ncbi:MAG: hypothetical protein ACLP4R_21240 [Solirubrobacteraceae bacterium]
MPHTDSQPHTTDLTRKHWSTALGSAGLWTVRYGIGIVLILAGLALLIIDLDGIGVDGFAMGVGGGLSIIMLNALYRFGVSDSEERARHDEALRYLEEHGEWPDDPAWQAGRR